MHAAANVAESATVTGIAATGAPNNVFTLPGKTLSGMCGWSNVVGFGLDLPSGLESQASECHVDLVNIDSTSCISGTLNSKNLVDDLRLAATKASSPTYIVPTVGTVKYRSRVGAYEQDVTASGGVEHKDASAEQLAIREVNMSTYLFQTSDLLQVLGQLSADNAQSEYYLTDCASLLREQGRPVAALPVLKECESLSINNVDELKQVDEKMRAMGYA